MNAPIESTFRGMDKMRELLVAAGWNIQLDQYSGNYCNWLAYKRSSQLARRCESNADKEGIQIVLRPIAMTELTGIMLETVEVDVSGEYEGQWYRMTAYGIGPEEITENPAKLNLIEARLVKAWNEAGK